MADDAEWTEEDLTTCFLVLDGWHWFIRDDGSRTLIPPPMPIIVRYLPDRSPGHRGPHAETGREGTADLSSHR